MSEAPYIVVYISSMLVTKIGVVTGVKFGKVDLRARAVSVVRFI